MPVNVLGKRLKAKLTVSEGLTKAFYALGSTTAEKVCSRIGIYPKMRINQLSEQQVLLITKELSDLTLENDARKKIHENIDFKRKIGSYSGMRHVYGLPVHGQNTRNNAKTARRLNRVFRRGFHSYSFVGPTSW